MDKTLQDERLTALAKELAKDLKTPEDLSKLTSQLLKMSVEGALNAEMDHHLGYERHASKGRNGGNSRNGCSRKTLKSKDGHTSQ